MAFSRRKFLMGVGGAVVGLPFLEGLVPKEARADAGPPPFALFYRRANGVQQAIYSKNSYPSLDGMAISEPREQERWWPTSIPFGAVTKASLAAATASALSELGAYGDRIGIVKGLRHPYGQENAHPEGAVQGLTGAGVAYTGNDATSGSLDLTDPTKVTSMGESLDNRIARELGKGPNGEQVYSKSLYMGVKMLGEASISWTKSGASLFPEVAQENLFNVYDSLFMPLAGDQASRDLLLARRKSVNDLVRADLVSLRNDARLSTTDRERLDLHMSSIRDLETELVGCTVPDGLLGEVNSYDTNSIIQKMEVIAKLAVLAVACGVRRSILINTGRFLDQTQYTEVSATAGQYQFHALSHRLTAEFGAPLTLGSDLHHAIDRFHLQRFRRILDLLNARDAGNGQTLLDRGTCVHYSDLGSGEHIVTQLPYLYVGGANNALNTGIYVNEDKQYLVKFLNTIGAAVGCKNIDGLPLDDFNADTNNSLPRNYCWNYYDVPQPPKPAAGDVRPAIKGRLMSLVKA